MADVLQIEAGDTLHLTGWSVDGALGAFVELESTVPGSPYYLVNDTAGVFTSSYLIISDAQASADALWTADATCADFGGNSGWFDEASPACGDRLYIEPGDTLHVTGWSVDGAPGLDVLITSYPPSGAHSIIADSGGPFASDWLNISHSDATPVNDWSAGANSFDAGNNLADGWFGAAAVYVDAIGCVVWAIPWAGTAAVTTPGLGATVAAATSEATTSAQADAAGAQVEATPSGTDASAYGLPAGASAQVTANNPDATINTDTTAVLAVAATQTPAGATQADAVGALAVSDTGVGDTVVRADSTGATVSTAPSKISGQVVGAPGGVKVSMGAQVVAAGVTTDAIKAMVGVITGRGETILAVNVLSGALATVAASHSTAYVVMRPSSIVIEVIAQSVDGRRSRRIVEFEIQDANGIHVESEDMIARFEKHQALYGIWPESSS